MSFERGGREGGRISVGCALKLTFETTIDKQSTHPWINGQSMIDDQSFWLLFPVHSIKLSTWLIFERVNQYFCYYSVHSQERRHSEESRVYCSPFTQLRPSFAWICIHGADNRLNHRTAIDRHPNRRVFVSVQGRRCHRRYAERIGPGPVSVRLISQSTRDR